MFLLKHMLTTKKNLNENAEKNKEELDNIIQELFNQLNKDELIEFIKTSV
ncbi:MAG: hypothetical protein KHZ90_08560 [Veillonella parvula]|uniref:Uncharacterized protein n=1 Tax=Veillonella parvula TaxID=29466 RepID=A0A943ABI3_VEIPA|nr:hypothetical protein [Veillonella parvula]MBS4893813.1 hypothetical protein [Veillonella parvula]